MYQRFFGLRDLPFELTPNPRFLYMTSQYREALSNLQYGLSAAKPITVLLGEAGTGKTTLLRKALASEWCRNIHCIYMNNPALTRAEFVQTLAMKFGCSESAAASKAVLLEELEPVLRQRRDRGELTALVIDEAQSLSIELLEEVRLLANIESASEKLLPLVLAGQPELADRLNDPQLRQLKQRVALRCELKPFDVADTGAYIASRLKAAGGEPFRVFTREAVTLIHEHASGIPRTVNIICDNALASGFALGRKPVDSDIVREVCCDFDLGAAASPDPEPAPEPSLEMALIPSAAVPDDDPGGEAEAEAGAADFPQRRRFSFFRQKRWLRAAVRSE